MKSRLREWFRRAGYHVIRTNHAAACYIDHPPRSVLDEVLLRVFAECHRLSFIQIGANDGSRADPIRHYVESCSWSGVMVEPLPQYFASLHAKYAHRPDLRLLNAAVDATTGERAIYRLRPEIPGLPDWAHGLASFSRTRLEDAARQLALSPGDIVSQSVHTVTWSEVRRLFGERACDVLVVDVEGFDVELLRMARLSEWRPRVVQFEHILVSRQEHLRFCEELLGTGYEVATDRGDTIAYLPAPGDGH